MTFKFPSTQTIYYSMVVLFLSMKMTRGIVMSLLEGCKQKVKIWAKKEHLDLGFEMEMRLF